jgi:hypothetical protein
MPIGAGGGDEWRSTPDGRAESLVYSRVFAAAAGGSRREIRCGALSRLFFSGQHVGFHPDETEFDFNTEL